MEPLWCLVWKWDAMKQKPIIASLTESCIPWAIHFEWAILARDSDMPDGPIEPIEPAQSNPHRGGND
jgi:hypothetical protein